MFSSDMTGRFSTCPAPVSPPPRAAQATGDAYAVNGGAARRLPHATARRACAEFRIALRQAAGAASRAHLLQPVPHERRVLLEVLVEDDVRRPARHGRELQQAAHPLPQL